MCCSRLPVLKSENHTVCMECCSSDEHHVAGRPAWFADDDEVRGFILAIILERMMTVFDQFYHWI